MAQGLKVKYRKIDLLVLVPYLLLIFFGWMNIFSSSTETGEFIWSINSKYVMDLVWIGTSLAIGATILFLIPHQTYSALAWPLYVVMIVLLLAVAVVGVEVNGSKSWFAIGPVRMQPAEFSKITTAMLLAHTMSVYDFSFKKKKNVVQVLAILLIPMLAILLEKETGSALIYLGFLLMFFREGMSGWVLAIGFLSAVLFIFTLVISPFVTLLILMGIIGILGTLYSRKYLTGALITAAVITLLSFAPKLLLIPSLAFLEKFDLSIWIFLLSLPAVIFFILRSLVVGNKLLRNLLLGYILGFAIICSVNFVFDHVLQDHQRSRIEVLLGMKEDIMDAGYNVHQSMIAIGSGGFSGKGFLHGTQTRFNFVPEQSTDFIFCTIGEEWGFLGSMFILSLYLMMILKMLYSAEKQKDKFNRIMCYCIAMCFLMHVAINICMTIGLMPVIGIPLPLLSYGGSSMWAFSILVFIYLRLDLERWK